MRFPSGSFTSNHRAPPEFFLTLFETVTARDFKYRRIFSASSLAKRDISQQLGIGQLLRDCCYGLIADYVDSWRVARLHS